MNPVIIIGAARTGTTWLSNILLQNFGLTTLQHPLHYGVKEPQLFQLNNYFNKLNSPTKFVEEMKDSDLFQLLKVGTEPRISQSYFDFFFDRMDELAKASNTPWFIKLCPEFLYDSDAFDEVIGYLTKRYAGVKFVVIHRTLPNYLLSYLNMPGESKSSRSKFWNQFPALTLGVARHTVLYHRAGQLPNATWISYEDLEQKPEEVFHRLEKEIGPLRHQRKISVKNSSDKTLAISGAFYKMVFRIGQSLFLCQLIVSMYGRWTKNRKPIIYNRIHLWNTDKELLKDHLKDRGELSLLDKMKDS